MIKNIVFILFLFVLSSQSFAQQNIDELGKQFDDFSKTKKKKMNRLISN